jgi:hypothetical protein
MTGCAQAFVDRSGRMPLRTKPSKAKAVEEGSLQKEIFQDTKPPRRKRKVYMIIQLANRDFYSCPENEYQPQCSQTSAAHLRSS